MQLGGKEKNVHADIVRYKIIRPCIRIVPKFVYVLAQDMCIKIVMKKILKMKSSFLLSSDDLEFERL